MKMFCLKELPLVLEFSYIHKIFINKEKSLSTKKEHQQPVHMGVIVGLPSTFASLTVGETKCPAKPSVPARICM
jgi:hypothetical protein